MTLQTEPWDRQFFAAELAQTRQSMAMSASVMDEVRAGDALHLKCQVAGDWGGVWVESGRVHHAHAARNESCAQCPHWLVSFRLASQEATKPPHLALYKPALLKIALYP